MPTTETNQANPQTSRRQRRRQRVRVVAGKECVIIIIWMAQPGDAHESGGQKKFEKTTKKLVDGLEVAVVNLLNN